MIMNEYLGRNPCRDLNALNSMGWGGDMRFELLHRLG